MTQKIIDAWMQHPTKTFLDEPCFDSLKRWQNIPEIKQELPIELTLAAMDGGKVDIGLLSAWHGPRGPLIPNELVYAFTQKYPDRLYGVAAVDVNQPMKAVAELRTKNIYSNDRIDRIQSLLAEYRKNNGNSGGD